MSGMRAFLTIVLVVTPTVLSGEIMIVEVMRDPDHTINGCGGETEMEWFEVYNSSGTAVDINGWQIDDDGASNPDHTIANGEALMVPAHGLLVLCGSSDTAVNWGVPCDYSYNQELNFQNGGDD